MPKGADSQGECHAIYVYWRWVSGVPDLDETVLNCATRGPSSQDAYACGFISVSEVDGRGKPVTMF